MIKYIELKSDCGDSGPAWIARVNASKTGQTIYFNGLALRKLTGGGISGNYIDLMSDDEYWVSGVKKKGTNRHWAGSGLIEIEESALKEFLLITGQEEFDKLQFTVCSDCPRTTGAQFEHIEHRKLS